jgi:hypothetical protein
MQILIYCGGAAGLGPASCLIRAAVQINILARANTAESTLLRLNLAGRKAVLNELIAYIIPAEYKDVIFRG